MLFISIVCLFLLYFASSLLDLNDPHVPYLCNCPQSFLFFLYVNPLFLPFCARPSFRKVPSITLLPWLLSD